MASTSDLKKGFCLIFKGEPHMVIDKTFVSPGKGSAFFRIKMRSLKNGAVSEFTFKSGEKIEEAPVQTQEFQYLYQQGKDYFFMNPRTYEQISLSEEIIGDSKIYLKENEIYRILMLDEQPVNLSLPLKIKLKVIEAEEAVKGDTANAATKPVKVETGYLVQVPLFVKKGDIIVINTEIGEYTARA
jgi:elongation factor P